MAPSPAEAAAPTLPGHPLRNRIVSALVLAPAALALVWLADRSPALALAFHAWIALAAGWMGHEWARLTGRNRSGPAGLLLMAGLVAAVGAMGLGAAPWHGLVGLAVAAAVVYGLARIEGVEAPGWLAAGALAIGAPCVAFAWLRQQPADGRTVVVWLLAVVWATDIGAYAVGRGVGGPRLAPRISPNKTWAGLLGGMVSAALAGGFVGAVVGGGPVLVGALGGGGLALVAQAGDLGESLAKRRFGVKDSGGLIPGHGGLLDRVDGLLATTPVVALAVWLKGGSVLGWT
jgi:phosphatidate cytidylyltransferase